MKRFVSCRHWLGALLVCSGVALAQQEVTLTARVALANSDQGSRPHEAGGVVLWLTPAAGTDSASLPALREPSQPRLVQHNKSFEPHVLVVPVGSMVAFPNRDPFFHNVFSLFEGKRFDLGLYEAGSTRDVHFDKPGISYIFCNIHPEMSAVVIALDTPYYGISDQRGEVVFPKVPAGRYTLRVWYEAALPETLKSMARDITVSEANSTLGVLRLTEAALPPGHKNLYGRDYDPPTPDNPAYSRP
jgi:plastocyanin